MFYVFLNKINFISDFSYFNFQIDYPILIHHFIIALLIVVILKQESIFFSCAWPLILHPTFGAVGSCVSKASEHKRKNQIEYNVLRLQQPSLDHHYKCTGGESTYQKCNRKYVRKKSKSFSLSY